MKDALAYYVVAEVMFATNYELASLDRPGIISNYYNSTYHTKPTCKKKGLVTITIKCEWQGNQKKNTGLYRIRFPCKT